MDFEKFSNEELDICILWLREIREELLDMNRLTAAEGVDDILYTARKERRSRR